jgi:hypothetical protein
MVQGICASVRQRILHSFGMLILIWSCCCCLLPLTLNPSVFLFSMLMLLNDKDGNLQTQAIYPRGSIFNHSCYPNATMHFLSHPSPHAKFYSIADIKQGTSTPMCYCIISCYLYYVWPFVDV